MDVDSKTRPIQFDRVYASDAYLYAFILGLAAVIDSLGEEEEPPVTLGFILLSGAAGFCNFVTLVDTIADNQSVGPWLRLGACVLATIVFLGYGIYKVLFFYGTADADWKEQHGSA